ncbi:cytochrome c oxidase subunit 3 [Bradyrhizobium sp. U87765 SZCCT0131]|uniref:cytochrome c oxidase subunit 3 n=1 Tax=unclassified Bradyrhizobium TaxID=2631580 RepID=UPI001BABA46B|nr:cytochrome c oxidase subunit 3 [Bradyrhizobium sp. U87765 SZCCT0131]MBR1259066.1 cytochrome c oxidase subunit 3 [Bradyrhizobium sp. U87765 SZCCT0134]MBR1305207.1 cytochrome c oxidase subunit 3 [Bradyrhizobium sp. U87765 SZCCT0110]MBR1320993.1 cytochrome c oxidase subunit 3 [Bradyrhizobium sp. U87765 SZCCT0109]MBR1350353.1 cytochrome c oxidase subunit 3 [Bradyrhizobium sp. U87765 SZCCT0048]
MSVIVLFMVGLVAVAAWWLSHQRLMAKPWLEEGVVGDFPGGGRLSSPTAKVGLGVFLAVVGSLFALIVSAYVMRMALLDWRPVPIPRLVWFNTAVLVLSSAVLQWTQRAARRGDRDGVTTGLLVAAVASIVFLLGQWLAWRQLLVAGYGVAGNPANSFFFLVTALHGLHLAGGIVALARPVAAVLRGADPRRLQLSVELCTIYWHFLLLVWLILLALLSGWTVAFFDICRNLVS